MPQLIEATAFAAALGVNVHLNFSGTAYGDVAQVQNALTYLGITNLRDKGGQADTAPYEALASRGFHFDFFAPHDPQLDPGVFAQRLAAFAAAHPGAIVSIEGPNEINGWPISFNGGAGLANGAQYQQALFAAVKASGLAAVPVINLSVAADSPAAYAPLGDLSGAADWGNAHIYVSFGAQPAPQFNTLLSYAQTVTPGRALSVTETGYNTLPSDTQLGVDEATQAKLILNLVLDAAKAGVAATYLYELVDNQFSGAGSWNHAGLFRSDWSPKPVVEALHNLTSAFANSSGATPALGAPDYAISGLAGGSALTVHEANGIYDIVVWAEPDIWDQFAHEPIAAAPQSVTISLAQPVGGYAVYDPLVSGAPIASGGATNVIPLSVTDHPLIVELHGAAGAPLSLDPVVTPPPPPTPPVEDGSLPGVDPFQVTLLDFPSGWSVFP